MSDSFLMNPTDINFSRVASLSPSIFIASLDTKSENLFICFAGHASLTQYKVSTPFSFLICVFSEHAGQNLGIVRFPLLVKFSLICGIIILALYTDISSPIPSISDLTILTL